MRHARPLLIALLALAALGWQSQSAQATHTISGGSPLPHIDQISIDVGPAGTNVGVTGNGTPAVGYRGGGDNLVDAEGAPDEGGNPSNDGVCGNGIDDDPDVSAVPDGVADDGCQVTLTPLETCAEIIDDGILNADEDFVDTLSVDVTVGAQPGTGSGSPGGIPPTGINGATHAWGYFLNWAPELLRVNSPQQFAFLIHTDGAGSPFTNASAPLPDLAAPWTADVSDAGPIDDGAGVLNRIRIEGDTAGIAALSIDGYYVLDRNSSAYTIDLINSAQIAVSKDGPDAGSVIGNSLGEVFHCPGPANPDDDGDGVYDIDEQNCGSDSLNTARVPERLDTPANDDGDGQINEPLPPGSGPYDCDGDGWPGSDEMGVYTAAGTANDQDPCGNTGWPSDLAGSSNALNIADINSFLMPLRVDGTFSKFGHPVPDVDDPTIGRWNLRQPANAVIDIADLNRLNPGVNTTQARPPMFGGQQAFFTNSGTCPYPP